MYLDELKKIYSYKYNTVLGDILISEAAGYIVGASFANEPPKNTIKETDLIKSTYMQLSEYLSGTRKYFDLQINPSGTIFQQKI